MHAVQITTVSHNQMIRTHIHVIEWMHPLKQTQ